MKVNFTYPRTGKRSTVILADHWVKNYLAVMSDSWQDHDKPDHQRMAIQHMLTWCADYYYDPSNVDRELAGLPKPNTCTFTTFLECYMAGQIYMRACLPYERDQAPKKKGK